MLIHTEEWMNNAAYLNTVGDHVSFSWLQFFTPPACMITHHVTRHMPSSNGLRNIRVGFQWSSQFLDLYSLTEHL